MITLIFLLLLLCLPALGLIIGYGQRLHLHHKEGRRVATTTPTLITAAPPPPPVIRPTVRFLLTIYGIEERRPMYTQIINNWLRNSHLDIYVTNSGGKTLGLSHPRLHEFVFEQEGPFQNPTFHESEALLRALDHFAFDDHDLVVKLTGKYFCPDLEHYLQELPPTTSLVLQHRHSPFNQNSELIGLRPPAFRLFLEACHRKAQTVMEKHLFRFAKYIANPETTVVLPPLSVQDRFPRHNGSILDKL